MMYHINSDHVEECDGDETHPHKHYQSERVAELALSIWDALWESKSFLNERLRQQAVFDPIDSDTLEVIEIVGSGECIAAEVAFRTLGGVVGIHYICVHDDPKGFTAALNLRGMAT